MPSLRSLAVAGACLCCLSACSATIAPPYNDGPRVPPSSSSRSQMSDRPAAKKPGSKTPRPPKGTGAVVPDAWSGSCEAEVGCSRTQRDCPQGTICVFAGAGPEGSCLTLEQRRYCQRQ